VSNSIEELITEPSAKREMTVYSLDPLEDPRWPEFVGRHPSASVFHAPGWLRALQRTYHYEPVAFTTSAPTEQLRNAVVFCVVRSWLTGRRLVCVPFSDHCEPLVASAEELNELRLYVQRIGKQQRCKYVEMRSSNSALQLDGVFQKTKTFYLHRLDLRPNPDALLRSFHRDCIQRKIRRAEREGLTCEEGRSEELVQKFYQLLLRTRRRLELPPQPRNWFRNLVDCLGDNVKIRMASKDGRPLASILTLSFKDVLVYKYGCSDERFHNLGGMPLLLWNAIQEGKRNGAREFDMGRSDTDNPGLIAFKEHWGATRSQLTYWRYPARQAPPAAAGWRMQAAKKIFAHIPDSFLIAAGKMFYRHIG
jgi:Acetyltransferase (GNAT) domain